MKFITSGVPNIIGSLMLKQPGAAEIFETSLVTSFLEKIITAIIIHRVAPDPPIRM